MNRVAVDGERSVLFVGVDTSRSRALAAVPRWSSRLGLPLQVQPVDVAPRAPDHVYRRIVDSLSSDPQLAGAVITSHKVAVYAAAEDRCAYVSPDARLLRECNVLASRPGGLAAYATDVVSMGAEVDRIWPVSRGPVVCLGAGGSAAALCLHLLRRAQPPQIVVGERHPDRTDRPVELLHPTARARQVDLHVHTGDGTWDDLVAAAAPGSLVVNATGLGKTDDSSPLSPAAVFPREATVWDLNYRGPLPFVARARAQAGPRSLEVHDGWHLFALGWLAALSALLDVDPPAGTDGSFAAIADEIGR